MQTSASSRIHVFITLFDVKFSFPHKLDSHGMRVGVVFVVVIVFILVVCMLTEILLSRLSAILVDDVMPCVLLRAPLSWYHCTAKLFHEARLIRRYIAVIVSSMLSDTFFCQFIRNCPAHNKIL